MRVKVIVFDLDDTLYDEIAFVKSGFRAVAEYFLPNDSDTMFETMMAVLENEGRGKVFDATLTHFGLGTKCNIKKALNIYRTHTPKISLNDDALEVVAHYKALKIPLYVVTDGNKIVQANKIKALGLQNYVKKSLITHRYGIINAKPSTYCFEKIAHFEAVEYKEIVYIGDNNNKDFVGIKKLGFQTIRIRQGMFKSVQKDAAFQAHQEIDSLRELKQLLKVKM